MKHTGRGKREREHTEEEEELQREGEIRTHTSTVRGLEVNWRIYMDDILLAILRVSEEDENMC